MENQPMGKSAFSCSKATEKRFVKTNISTQLKKLIKDITSYISDAPEDEKQHFFNSMKELKRSHRRKHPRKSCSMPVSYFVRDFGFIDSVANISGGGVFIETSENFPMGQEIRLILRSSDQKKHIETEGKVVWNPPRGIGVQFIKPPYDALEQLIEAA